MICLSIEMRLARVGKNLAAVQQNLNTIRAKSTKKMSWVKHWENTAVLLTEHQGPGSTIMRSRMTLVRRNADTILFQGTHVMSAELQ